MSVLLRLAAAVRSVSTAASCLRVSASSAVVLSSATYMTDQIQNQMARWLSRPSRKAQQANTEPAANPPSGTCKAHSDATAAT